MVLCYHFKMSENFNELTVFAPAKVNLHLAVFDRRQDGYHNLESVFLAVDFGDTLRFFTERGNSNKECKIEMSGDNLRSISMKDNIIYRALSLFRAKTGYSEDLKIKVDKQIPSGGGLGGGSSDAAAALLALNKIAGFPCSQRDLLDLALTLGSDVPFFIHETSCAYVSGRGEHVSPFNAPLLHLVIVNPGFPSDTAAAFRLLDKNREKNGEICVRNDDFAMRNELMKNSSFLTAGSTFFNDFLDVFPENEKTVYLEIISQLKEVGAYFANLSGSGSTCFGIFKDMEYARKAAELLDKKWNFVKAVKTYFVSK